MYKADTQTYFAKEFCIIDDKGKTRGRFLTDLHGDPTLELYAKNREGGPRLILKTYEDGHPGFALLDESGYRVTFSLPDNGIPEIRFDDKEGDNSIVLTVDVSKDITQLIVKDDAGTERVRLNISAKATDQHSADTRLILKDVGSDSDFDSIEPVAGA